MALVILNKCLKVHKIVLKSKEVKDNVMLIDYEDADAGNADITVHFI